MRTNTLRGATRRLTTTLAALAIAILPAACGDEPTLPAHAAQLDRAREATAKYQDLSRALADGYVDAKIVMQSMGHHYLNASLLDDRFEPDRPELLVYAPQDGRMQLVAVEYAVPLDKAASAPSGFDGTLDAWDRNTTYGLWTLHAWLWRDNAAGIFAARNTRVQLDPGSLQGMRGSMEHR